MAKVASSDAMRRAGTSPDDDTDSEAEVVCRLCHGRYKAITYTHLRFRHGIEKPQAYKDEFSLRKITAGEVRRRIAEQKVRLRRDDLTYIRMNWRKRSLRELSVHLHVTTWTVRAHARKLGLGLLVERWSGPKIVAMIRRAYQEGLSLHSGGVRRTLNPLFRAGIKYFGSWRRALAAANVPWELVARRRAFESWSRPRIVREIQVLASAGKALDYAFIERHHARLYAAARNHYGSWRKALRAAGSAR